MYQSGREGDKAKKHKSPAKSGRVGITGDMGGEGNDGRGVVPLSRGSYFVIYQMGNIFINFFVCVKGKTSKNF